MQCVKFNTGWIFEKTEKDSQLRAFQGKKNTVAVTLPYDAMIRENRERDCPAGAQFSADGCREVEIKIQIGGNRDGKK